MSSGQGKSHQITQIDKLPLIDLDIGLSTEDLANNLIDACATGKTDHLQQLMPQYLDKLEPTMPTPAYLLQTAARNGHAEAIRIVFEALPKDSQRPSYPWDPPWLGIPFSKVPEKWKTHEHSIALAGEAEPNLQKGL